MRQQKKEELEELKEKVCNPLSLVSTLPLTLSHHSWSM